MKTTIDEKILMFCADEVQKYLKLVVNDLLFGKHSTL